MAHTGTSSAKTQDSWNSPEDMNTYMYHHQATDDYWMPAYHRYPGGVGLRDYIIFCLLIGIAFGVGYLCSCANRKVS